jgi:hypothetical protein
MVSYKLEDITVPAWGIPLNEIWTVIKASDPVVLKERLARLPYREYLRTPYWYAVSQLAKKRAHMRCQVCNSGGQMQCHHRGENYSVRGNEHQNMSELTVLCDKCHRQAHGLPVAKKKKNRHKFPSNKPGGKNYAAQGQPIAWSSWRDLGRKSHGWKGSIR